MNTFLRAQGLRLLQNEFYAFFVAAVLALTPITAWLSLAVVALVTLRNNSYNGLKVFVIALATTYISCQLNASLSHTFFTVFITFTLGYSAAVLLKVSANWKLVAICILTIALASIVLIHEFLPNYANEQYTLLLSSLKEIEPDHIMVHLLEKQRSTNPVLIFNSLIGIKVLSVIFSALGSLLLARSVQSMLFYPGGFRKEMLEFRASRIGVVLLISAAFEVYQNNPVAISCLPLLAVYLMAAGISLFFNMMARKKDLITILLLFAPLIIVPYIMLPVYIFFGSLDSLVDFRLRLALNQKIKN